MNGIATYQTHHPQHLILLGPTDDYLARVLARGVAVTVLTEETRITAKQRAFLENGNLVAFSDTKALLARALEISNARPVDAVLSLTEMGMLPAALIASLLGKPGPSLLATVHCCNKFLMRQQMAFANSTCNIPHRLISTLAELEIFRTEHGAVVVKPIDGTGSVNVARLAPHQAFTTPLPFPFLAEKYIAGTEYSCETFSHQGQHQFLALTEKFLGGVTGFVETGHRINPDDQPISQSMREQVFATLDQIGISDGPAHTEIKICDDVLYVIETHNRPGGDRIWQLVEEARRFDMVGASVNALLGVPPPQLPGEKYCCALISYPQRDPGIVNAAVRDASAIDRAVVWHDLHVEIGDIIKPWFSSHDRNGAFLISADDEGTLQDKKLRIENNIFGTEREI